MSQPANLPRWADTVSGDPTRVKQPPSLKQDAGWNAGERPANQHMNWLLWTIYLWINYLKNLTSEALTWIGAQVFNGTVNFIGNVIGIATFTNPPVAPDYHFSTFHKRMFPATLGWAATGTWAKTGSAALSFDSGAAAWDIPLVVESGESATIVTSLIQGTAVAGGTVQLFRASRLDGSPVSVDSQPIANSTAFQLLTYNIGNVVADNYYWVQISFAAGAGGKVVYCSLYTFIR